jgi:hypothetical protein
MHTLEALCQAVSEASHTKVFIGTVPLNLFFHYQERQDGRPQKARNALVSLIQRVHSGSVLSWRLLYDPGQKVYALNIHEIAAAKE